MPSWNRIIYPRKDAGEPSYWFWVGSPPEGASLSSGENGTVKNPDHKLLLGLLQPLVLPEQISQCMPLLGKGFG